MGIGGVANLSIIITAIDKVSGTLKKVGSNLAATGAKMKSVGKGMTMGLTLPLIGVGVAAGKMAMDFSDATRYANTMMGATGEEMKVMKKTALDLAAHTGKAAADIMGSYYGIASAGYKGAEADRILKVATEGATAGFIEQEKSVDALVKVMSIYDKKGDEARETMDVMFGIVDKGLLTFDDLSTSFARASQFAVPLSIDYKEMGASLGFLSKKFSSTDEAATGLMGLTRAFVKPSNEMKEVTAAWAKAQGLATDTTTAQMVEVLGLKGTLDLLQETTEGNVETMGKLIPEATGLTAALYLTSEEGAKELNTNLEYLNESAGLTKEKFDEASESAKVKLAKSMERLKGILITVGAVLLENILPIFDKFAKSISKLSEWFGKLSPGMQKIILMFFGLVAAAGPLLMILGMILPALPAIGAVFVALTGPIGLVIAAVIALVVAAVFLGKKIAEVVSYVIVNWDRLVDGVKKVKDNIINAWYDLINWFKKLPDKIWNAIKSIPGKIASVFKIPKIKLPSWIPIIGGKQDEILGSRQFGGEIPETGKYLLHKGEEIIPKGKGTGGDINIYIQGGNYLDRDAGEKFAEILGKMLRRELRY